MFCLKFFCITILYFVYIKILIWLGTLRYSLKTKLFKLSLSLVLMLRKQQKISSGFHHLLFLFAADSATATIFFPAGRQVKLATPTHLCTH